MWGCAVLPRKFLFECFLYNRWTNWLHISRFCTGMPASYCWPRLIRPAGEIAIIHISFFALCATGMSRRRNVDERFIIFLVYFLKEYYYYIIALYIKYVKHFLTSLLAFQKKHCIIRLLPEWRNGRRSRLKIDREQSLESSSLSSGTQKNTPEWWNW